MAPASPALFLPRIVPDVLILKSANSYVMAQMLEFPESRAIFKIVESVFPVIVTDDVQDVYVPTE